MTKNLGILSLLLICSIKVDACSPSITAAIIKTFKTNSDCTVPTGTVGLTIDSVNRYWLFSFTTNPSVAMPVSRCSSCISGERNFYKAHTGNPDIRNAIGNNKTSLVVDCKDLCACSSSGVCCQLDSGNKPIFGIIPYCDLNGNCRNNLFIDHGSALNCSDGSRLKFDDQIDKPEKVLPLNSDVYFNVDSISCRGCDAIKKNVCRGPTVSV